MKKCIIIDDENKARLLLKNMLADVCPELNVMATCDDLPSGIKAIKKYNPDLVFLDIEMPGHSGLEILEYFEDDEINFEIIFCNGYKEYAIQAFKLSAIDYLLKPINPQILKESVERFLKKNQNVRVQEYRALQGNMMTHSDFGDKCIVVNLSNSTRFIKIKEIIMLRADGSYCEIYLANNEKLLTSKNLKYFEDLLNEIPYFFRCHKSYIVNLKTVSEYNKSENQLILQNKLTSLISADKSEVFIEKMKLLQ